MYVLVYVCVSVCASDVNAGRDASAHLYGAVIRFIVHTHHHNTQINYVRSVNRAKAHINEEHSSHFTSSMYDTSSVCIVPSSTISYTSNLVRKENISANSSPTFSSLSPLSVLSLACS